MRVREYLGVSDTAELIAMLATLVVRLPVGDIVKWRRKREREREKRVYSFIAHFREINRCYKLLARHAVSCACGLHSTKTETEKKEEKKICGRWLPTASSRVPPAAALPPFSYLQGSPLFSIHFVEKEGKKNKGSRLFKRHKVLGVKMSGRIGTTSSSALHKNKFEGGCEECSTSSVPAKRVSTKIKLIFFPFRLRCWFGYL